VGAFILSFLFQKVFRSAFFRFNKSFFSFFFFGISKFESLFLFASEPKLGACWSGTKDFYQLQQLK